MSDSFDFKQGVVRSTAKGDSGRVRKAERKGKLTPERIELIKEVTKLNDDGIGMIHITDMRDDLIMIAPRELEGGKPIPYAVRDIRGMIISVSRRTVVAHGDLMGTASVMPTLHYENDHLIINSTCPVEENPKSIECLYEKYIPHVNLRVIRWDGKTYLSSHTTIDVVQNESRWGDHGIPFHILLKECGLESLDLLFPAGCNYSHHVYSFDVCHPSINVCSYLDAPKGFLIERMSYHAWVTKPDYGERSGTPIGKPPTEEEIGVPHEKHWSPTEYIKSPRDGPGFYRHTREISDDEYTRFLELGYYDVPGPFGTGEAIMISIIGNGQTERHLLMSPAFDRRKNGIWKNDYNIYHSCIMMFSSAATVFEDKQFFMASWPPFVPVTNEMKKEAKEQSVPLISIAYKKGLPSDEDIVMMNKPGVDAYKYMLSRGKVSRLYNLEDALNVIHTNLIYSSTPYYTDLVERSKMRFAVDVRDLISFIQSMEYHIPKDFPIDNVAKNGPRESIEKILANAIISAKKSISSGQNVYIDPNGVARHYSERVLVNFYIASTVPKMEGNTLYRMIRAFRLYDHSSSLLITEPNARPKALFPTQGELSKEFDKEFPALSGNNSDLKALVEGMKLDVDVKIEEDLKGVEEKLPDQTYSSAPPCSWASVVSRKAEVPIVSWASPSDVVHKSPKKEMWSDMMDTPVTPPSLRPNKEPLSPWLTSTVTTPTGVVLPPSLASDKQQFACGSGNKRVSGQSCNEKQESSIDHNTPVSPSWMTPSSSKPAWISPSSSPSSSRGRGSAVGGRGSGVQRGRSVRGRGVPTSPSSSTPVHVASQDISPRVNSISISSPISSQQKNENFS